MKIAAIDFEFNRVTHSKLNLVSCVYQDLQNDKVHKYWLHNDQVQWKKLANELKKYDCFLGHNVSAEGRSFIALGLNPLDFKWLDTFLEYRCISNHNDDIQYGKHYIDGVVRVLVKPKKPWEKDDSENEEGTSGHKIKHGLAEAVYKFLNIKRDVELKDKTRDLIISDPKEFTESQKKQILDYNEEDVRDLSLLYQAIKSNFRKYDPSFTEEKYLEEALWRGRYGAHTAIMENRGYPINYEATKNFSDQVPAILYEVQREINELFPEIKPFTWDKISQKYKWNQNNTREWIKKGPYASKWERTDTGLYALSLDAFTTFYDFKHDYPKDNFGAQMVRFLKLRQSLNGFLPPPPNSKKRRFWDAVGPDKWVRPYMNIFGSQSGRSQPPATSFMMLKPAWMRSLVEPPKGYFIAGIDYSSQEFLISALESGDENMLDSYASGDVYLSFAKLTGAVPQDATKQSHKKERDLAKSSVLGLSFLMSKYGLAIKLTEDTGRVWTEEEAQEQIDLFYDTYSDLAIFQKEVREFYESGNPLKLPDGWTMFCDNDNFRSSTNFAIQGCLSGDCRVLVRDMGYQKLSTIDNRVGIEVWQGDKFVKADCLPSGKKRKVTITLVNGQEIHCSPDHKFLTVGTNGSERWKKPEEFGKQEYIRLSEEMGDFNSNVKIKEFYPGNSINSMSDKLSLGILLGRIASDGWASQKCGVNLDVAEHEKEIIPTLCDICEKFGLSFTVKTYNREKENKKPMHHIRIKSANFMRQLASELEIKTSDFSHPFYWHSKEFMRGFLIGYIDGDGGISGTAISIAFGKGELKEKKAESIFKMLSVFGIKARIFKYGYRTNVKINQRELPDFLRSLHFLNPKKNIKLKSISRLEKKKTTIGRVERVKSVDISDSFIDMWDIVNCENRRFVADGLVTHNTGAAIMRRAVDIAVSKGVDILFTLHDALYMIAKVGEEEKIGLLRDAMSEAFSYYYKSNPYLYEKSKMIRLDPFAWSPDYEKDSTITLKDGWVVDVSDLYRDERAIKEYEKFSKYFKRPEEMDL